MPSGFRVLQLQAQAAEITDLSGLWVKAAYGTANKLTKHGRTPEVLAEVAELEGYRRELESRADRLRQECRGMRVRITRPLWPTALTAELAAVAAREPASH